MLKAGWCTVLFYAFLQGKATTQTVKGGNMDEIYKGGTFAKSQMLARVHPDCSFVKYRFRRWHHYVDYRKFNHLRLKLKSDVEIKNEPDNYGMKLLVKNHET
jgi:hypothetical protein